MEIILKAKGFVTNSSSTNYWLDNLASGELEITSSTPALVTEAFNRAMEKQEQEKKEKVVAEKQNLATAVFAADADLIISEDKNLKNVTIDFSLWFIFSIILIIIFIFKLKKHALPAKGKFWRDSI